MTTNGYLIANGWRPSPTIRDCSAWEHPVYSLVPRDAFPTGGYGNACDIRMAKDCAVMVTLVLQRLADDAPRRTSWMFESLVEVMSSYAHVLP